MASCKDCIHEKVCNYFDVDLNEEGAEKCVCFKDRNRFVELPYEAIRIVKKWSDEHPQKTYLMDFVKKYPNAPLEENGTPRFCPYELGYTTKEDCYMTTKEDFDDRSQYCKQCWSTPIESEVK